MISKLGPAVAAFLLVVGPALLAQDIGSESGGNGAETQAEEGQNAPEPTYILSASDRFLALYGADAWLDPELEICLEEGEAVQLGRPASEIASMELRGALCTRVADAAEVATIIVEREQARPRARTGMTRGAAPAATNAVARPPSFRIASGTGDVLSRFPVGTRVTNELELCLARGQQVTLISSTGQRVTYRGPGCARRNTRPSATNQGGFTFGWNGWGAGRGVAVLP